MPRTSGGWQYHDRPWRISMNKYWVHHERLDEVIALLRDFL